MSKMLQALKNLSSRTTPGQPAEKPAAAAVQTADASAPAPAAADPVLPPLNRTQHMKEVLARHLSAPTQTEIIRSPDAADLREPAEDFPDPVPAPTAGSMTVPMAAAAQELRRPAVPQRQQVDFLPQPPAEPAFEPPVATPIVDGPGAEPHAEPSLRDSRPVGARPPGAITLLLSQLGEDPVSRQYSRDSGQAPESRAQKAASREQKSEVAAEAVAPAQPQIAPPPLPLARSSSLATSPLAVGVAPAVGPSPLDHLADPRPLVTIDPNAEQAPPPAPMVLPPRSISRVKTRLEERVFEIQSDPSRSLPYRELADRLRQDLRQLPGRCLLFAGVGAASHPDDVMPHVASLLAEEDAEVLLIDANFARAAMTVGFGALKETGLGDFAEAGVRSEELVLPTRLPNVSLLPAGRKALPDDLGVIDRVAQLLAKLEERFSLVMIDGGAHSGPLLPALARFCDATYLVVRLGATDARAATSALKSFRATGARVMGCVATTAT
jgi:hypothetical protein